MSFDGLFVSEEGKVRWITKTNTLSEAKLRSEQFRTLLLGRDAHEQVLRHCRPELLKEDYYEAAFESIKGLAERLRLLLEWTWTQGSWPNQSSAEETRG